MRSLPGHHVYIAARRHLLPGLVIAVVMAGLLALPASALGAGYVHLQTISGPGSGSGNLNSPYDVCIDAKGCIYVSDRGNYRVDKFAPDGAFMFAWGSDGTGPGQFSAPRGICYDPEDDLICVCDDGNERVQEFTTSGTYVRTVLDGTVVHPWGVCWDGAHLQVVNWGDGQVTACSINGSGVYTWGNGYFSSDPWGITCDPTSGDYYVTDPGNGQVAQFDSSYNFIRYIGAGTFSATNGPIGAAIDTDGNLLVSDAAKAEVFKFTPTGTLLGSFPVTANLADAFSSPYGLSVDSQGRVYVADNAADDVPVWVYDDTPPTITTDNDGEWHSQPFTIELSASDDYSGSSAVSWSTDGGTTWTVADHFDVPAPTDHSADGVHALQLKATDGAGNAATKTIHYKVDTRAPITQVSLSDAKGTPFGFLPQPWWDNSDITLTFSAADVGSGVVETDYSTDGVTWLPVPGSDQVVFSAETPATGLTVSYRSLDACVDAPNKETAKQVTLYIDKTPPQVRALNNVIVRRGGTATFKFTVSDNLSSRCKMVLVVFKPSGGSTKMIYVGYRSSPNTATPSTQTKRYRVTLAAGVYRWEMFASDLANNTGQSAIKKFTVK